MSSHACPEKPSPLRRRSDHLSAIGGASKVFHLGGAIRIRSELHRAMGRDIFDVPRLERRAPLTGIPRLFLQGRNAGFEACITESHQGVGNLQQVIVGFYRHAPGIGLRANANTLLWGSPGEEMRGAEEARTSGNLLKKSAA